VKSIKKCKVESCSEKHSAKGLCKKHYELMKKQGDVSLYLRENLR